MSTESIIEKSIEKVQKMGIKIVRGPLFVRNGDKLVACDCFGAVLISHGKAQKDFPKGWLKTLCVDLLGKDTYWMSRFDHGFNQGYALETYKEEKGGKKTYFEDDVSKSGARLARQLGLYGKK